MLKLFDDNTKNIISQVRQGKGTGRGTSLAATRKKRHSMKNKTREGQRKKNLQQQFFFFLSTPGARRAKNTAKKTLKPPRETLRRISVPRESRNPERHSEPLRNFTDALGEARSLTSSTVCYWVSLVLPWRLLSLFRCVFT